MEADWRKQLVQQEVYGVKERVTIATATAMFIASKRDLVSYRSLVQHLEHVVAFFKDRRYLDELRSADLERLRLDHQQMGYANQTTRHMIGSLRGAIKYMARMGYQVPTVEYPKITHTKTRLRYLSFEEERRLLVAVDPRRSIKGLPEHGRRGAHIQKEMDDLHDMVVVLLDTGARHGEVAGLKWDQIDLDARSISLWRPKVQNESVLFMTDRVHAILVNRQQGGTETSVFVFENRSGASKGYSAATLRRAFDRAGLPDCSAHTLRHTHATRLIQNGLNLYEVKEMLGHSDIKTTMRYAHIEQRSVSVKAREVIDRLNKAQQKPTLGLAGV
jgi:integrase